MVLPAHTPAFHGKCGTSESGVIAGDLELHIWACMSRYLKSSLKILSIQIQGTSFCYADLLDAKRVLAVEDLQRI